MKYQFSLLDLMWVHLSFWQNMHQDADYDRWEKLGKKVAVSPADNPAGQPPLVLLDADPLVETDGPLSREVFAVWAATKVEREFTIAQLETLQMFLGRLVYHPTNRHYVKDLKERLKAYHTQAQAEDALKKLPQESVNEVARRLRGKSKGKVTPIADAIGEDDE